MPLMFFDPGQLTARLDLEVAAETADGQGGVTKVWSVQASLWARIEPVSAKSDEIGGQLRPVITHRIWMRYRSDVTTVMRFRKGGRIFLIRSCQDADETGRYLICLCEEGSL